MYEKLGHAAQHIQSLVPVVPKVGLVLGSGLGLYVEEIQDKTIIPYSEIPYFRPTSVEGHEGRLILGTIKNVPIAVLQGRLHVYEGIPMEEIVFPVRVLATLGIEALILTNASGGINPAYGPGDLVIINDHINFMGQNPLIGPNISELGPRFPDMTEAYSKDLQQYIQESAQEIGHTMKSGVYCALPGPTYETPAEVKMLGILGADMVGMSTVPESIAANHLGLKVCGISCITNMAAGITSKKLNHQEVKAEAQKAITTFSKIITHTIEKIGKGDRK